MTTPTDSKGKGKASNKPNALIVGIDFGTTYSGIAWASTSDGQIQTVRTWPGAPGKLLDKVKSLLAYKETKGAVSDKYKWGFEVKDDTENPLQWFKLLLHKGGQETTFGFDKTSTSGTRRLPRLEATVTKKPKTKCPVDLVTDYLSALHKYFLHYLQKEYPSSLVGSLGKETPVYYYLTVPTLWTREEKQLTLQAAKAAGIGALGSVQLIAEPEAAAAYCFTKYRGTLNSLKPDDVYVIVDCGGGTVDLISYEVKQIEPTLQLTEAAVGESGFCGSVYLNDRFEKLVKDRMGASAFAKLTARAKEKMREYFDLDLKLRFGVKTIHQNDGGSENDSEDDVDNRHAVPVEGALDDTKAGISLDTMFLSKDDVKSIFDPIFAEITKLVKRQLSKAETNMGRPIAGVILAGGFGGSEYLREHLESTLSTQDGRKVQVLKAPDAWQAVVKGAVQHGLSIYANNGEQSPTDVTRARSGIVSSRRLRASYGVSVVQLLCPCPMQSCHVGLPRNKIRLSLQFGRLVCTDRMKWFIKKGEVLPENKPFSLSLMAPRPETSDDFNRKQTILFSEADQPPTDQEHPTVQTLVDFEHDYSDVDLDQHVMKTPHSFIPGQYIEQIPYKLFMKATEATDVEFWAEVNGSVVGRTEKVNAAYEE